MISVLVICHDCKEDIRPLKGDKYGARLIGGRYRPLCMGCTSLRNEKRTSKLTLAAGSAATTDGKSSLQVTDSDDAAVHVDAAADTSKDDVGRRVSDDVSVQPAGEEVPALPSRSNKGR